MLQRWKMSWDGMIRHSPPANDQRHAMPTSYNSYPTIPPPQHHHHTTTTTTITLQHNYFQRIVWIVVVVVVVLLIMTTVPSQIGTEVTEGRMMSSMIPISPLIFANAVTFCSPGVSAGNIRTRRAVVQHLNGSSLYLTMNHSLSFEIFLFDTREIDIITDTSTFKELLHEVDQPARSTLPAAFIYINSNGTSNTTNGDDVGICQITPPYTNNTVGTPSVPTSFYNTYLGTLLQKCDFVLGMGTSRNSVILSKYLSHIPVFLNSETSNDISDRELHPLVLRTVPPDSATVTFLSQFMKALQWAGCYSTTLDPHDDSSIITSQCWSDEGGVDDLDSQGRIRTRLAPILLITTDDSYGISIRSELDRQLTNDINANMSSSTDAHAGHTSDVFRQWEVPTFVEVVVPTGDYDGALAIIQGLPELFDSNPDSNIVVLGVALYDDLFERLTQVISDNALYEKKVLIGLDSLCQISIKGLICTQYVYDEPIVKDLYDDPINGINAVNQTADYPLDADTPWAVVANHTNGTHGFIALMMDAVALAMNATVELARECLGCPTDPNTGLITTDNNRCTQAMLDSVFNNPTDAGQAFAFGNQSASLLPRYGGTKFHNSTAMRLMMDLLKRTELSNAASTVPISSSTRKRPLRLDRTTGERSGFPQAIVQFGVEPSELNPIEASGFTTVFAPAASTFLEDSESGSDANVLMTVAMQQLSAIKSKLYIRGTYLSDIIITTPTTTTSSTSSSLSSITTSESSAEVNAILSPGRVLVAYSEKAGLDPIFILMISIGIPVLILLFVLCMLLVCYLHFSDPNLHAMKVSGTASVVVVRVDELESLWKHAPSETASSLLRYTSVVRHLIQIYHGYELESSQSEKFRILFEDPEDAIMFSYALQEALVDDASTLQPRQKEQLKKRMLQVGFDAATEAGVDLADMVGGVGNPGRSHRGTHGGPEVIPEILGADAILKLAAFAEHDTINEMQSICATSWREIEATRAANSSKPTPKLGNAGGGGGAASNRMMRSSTNRNAHNNNNTILPLLPPSSGGGGRRIHPLTGQQLGGGMITSRGTANQLPHHQLKSEVAFKRTINTKIVVYDGNSALLKGKHAVHELIEKANARALKEHEQRKEAARRGVTATTATSRNHNHNPMNLRKQGNQLKGALRTAPMHRSLWTRAARTEINTYYRRQNTLSTEALGDKHPAGGGGLESVSPSQKRNAAAVASSKHRHHRVDEFDYDDDDNEDDDDNNGSDESDSITTSSTGTDTDDDDDYDDETSTSEDGTYESQTSNNSSDDSAWTIDYPPPNNNRGPNRPLSSVRVKRSGERGSPRHVTGSRMHSREGGVHPPISGADDDSDASSWLSSYLYSSESDEETKQDRRKARKRGGMGNHSTNTVATTVASADDTILPMRRGVEAGVGVSPSDEEFKAPSHHNRRSAASSANRSHTEDMFNNSNIVQPPQSAQNRRGRGWGGGDLGGGGGALKSPPSTTINRTLVRRKKRLPHINVYYPIGDENLPRAYEQLWNGLRVSCLIHTGQLKLEVEEETQSHVYTGQVLDHADSLSAALEGGQVGATTEFRDLLEKYVLDRNLVSKVASRWRYTTLRAAFVNLFKTVYSGAQEIFCSVLVKKDPPCHSGRRSQISLSSFQKEPKDSCKDVVELESFPAWDYPITSNRHPMNTVAPSSHNQLNSQNSILGSGGGGGAITIPALTMTVPAGKGERSIVTANNSTHAPSGRDLSESDRAETPKIISPSTGGGGASRSSFGGIGDIIDFPQGAQSQELAKSVNPLVFYESVVTGSAAGDGGETVATGGGRASGQRQRGAIVPPDNEELDQPSKIQRTGLSLATATGILLTLRRVGRDLMLLQRGSALSDGEDRPLQVLGPSAQSPQTKSPRNGPSAHLSSSISPGLLPVPTGSLMSLPSLFTNKSDMRATTAASTAHQKGGSRPPTTQQILMSRGGMRTGATPTSDGIKIHRHADVMRHQQQVVDVVRWSPLTVGSAAIYTGVVANTGDFVVLNTHFLHSPLKQRRFNNMTQENVIPTSFFEKVRLKALFHSRREFFHSDVYKKYMAKRAAASQARKREKELQQHLQQNFTKLQQQQAAAQQGVGNTNNKKGNFRPLSSPFNVPSSLNTSTQQQQQQQQPLSSSESKQMHRSGGFGGSHHTPSSLASSITSLNQAASPMMLPVLSNSLHLPPSRGGGGGGGTTLAQNSNNINNRSGIESNNITGGLPTSTGTNLHHHLPRHSNANTTNSDSAQNGGESNPLGFNGGGGGGGGIGDGADVSMSSSSLTLYERIFGKAATGGVGGATSNSTSTNINDELDDEGDLMFETSDDDDEDGSGGYGRRYQTIQEELQENLMAFRNDSREAPGEMPGDHRGQYILKKRKLPQEEVEAATAALVPNPADGDVGGGGGKDKKGGGPSTVGTSPSIQPITAANDVDDDSQHISCESMY